MNEAKLKEKQKFFLEGYKLGSIFVTYGMSLAYNDNNEAVWTLPFNPGLTNGISIHGGAIATLIDSAGWFTAAQYYDAWLTTVEISTRFLDSEKSDDLVATGHVVKIGQRIATIDMTIKAKTTEKLVATGSGTYIVTNTPVPVLSDAP